MAFLDTLRAAGEVVWNLISSPFRIIYDVVGIVGDGLNFIFYGVTLQLYPSVLITALVFTVFAGVVKFIWHY